MPKRKRVYAPRPTTTKRYRKGRKRVGRARPMRALKTNYRSIAVHRFVRETMPLTLNFHIIPSGPAGFPAMGYLNFDNLQFDELVQAQQEFGVLFARYKVDKIETFLTPMFQQVTETFAAGANYSLSPALRITRVNTKWFNQPFTISANSDAQLAELAQIQGKSVRGYASSRSMKLTTINPGVSKKGVLDSTGAEIAVRGPCPWMNITTDSDIPLQHNSLIFAERTDGSDLTTDWKYRVVHKVYFRCSQVG